MKKPIQVCAVALATASVQALAQVPPAGPVARDDVYELNTLTLDVLAPGLLANDSGNGISTSGFTLPSSGTINSIGTDGAFKYTPVHGFAGVATFGYTIADAANRVSSATVTIDASRSVPVARNDSYTLSATTLTVSAPGLLANDTGGIGAISLSSFTNPSAGTISGIATGGAFVYTPTQGFAGVASFKYSITDDLGRVSTASVQIDAASSVPEAVDDSFSVLSGGKLDIAPPGLLANDRGGIGGVSLASFTNPNSGSLQRIVTDGSFTYQSAAGFTGVAGFDYTAVDALGRTSLGHVTINVLPVPEPASWALLAGGLALVSTRARQRRCVPAQ